MYCNKAFNNRNRGNVTTLFHHCQHRWISFVSFCASSRAQRVSEVSGTHKLIIDKFHVCICLLWFWAVRGIHHHSRPFEAVFGSKAQLSHCVSIFVFALLVWKDDISNDGLWLDHLTLLSSPAVVFKSLFLKNGKGHVTCMFRGRSIVGVPKFFSPWLHK